MFEPSSRYYAIKTATLTSDAGKVMAYKRRRFLPFSESLATIATVTVHEGERLDTIAATSLGDPEQYWQICDANKAMRPRDLTEAIGGRLCIPLPQP